MASVIDGDTLSIHGVRIHLSGVDALEPSRRCGRVNVGQSAALALDGLVRGRTVSCVIDGRDHHRSLATCTAGGADLASLMVARGWARDWPRYSRHAYQNEESAARAAHRGLWALACPANLWGYRNYN